MKKIILSILISSQFIFAQDEMSFFGSQFSRGSIYLGSEVLQYDVTGSNAPADVQGDPNIYIKARTWLFLYGQLRSICKIL